MIVCKLFVSYSVLFAGKLLLFELLFLGYLRLLADYLSHYSSVIPYYLWFICLILFVVYLSEYFRVI